MKQEVLDPTYDSLSPPLYSQKYLGSSSPELRLLLSVCLFPSQVIVSDNGAPPLRSTATVVIRVLDDNDNQPKFTDKLFHVKLPVQHRQAGKREVCRMVARDDDEGSNAMVTYKLHENQDERFEIDPVTGVVTSHGDFWPGNYSILSVGSLNESAVDFSDLMCLLPSGCSVSNNKFELQQT